jgi:hypothetical protein
LAALWVELPVVWWVARALAAPGWELVLVSLLAQVSVYQLAQASVYLSVQVLECWWA